LGGAVGDDQPARRIKGAAAMSTAVDKARESIMIDGEPRRLPPLLWSLFELLLEHRGSLVDYHQIEERIGLYRREHLRRLRQLLEGSHYKVVCYRDLGLELHERGVKASAARVGRARRHGS
jgi:hypothetical protein